MEEILGKPDREVATMAVRHNSKAYIEAGIRRLASSNFLGDYRDTLSSICVYYDAAHRVGLEAGLFLTEVSQRFNEEFKKIVATFVNRKEEDKSLESFGFRVEYTPEFAYKKWYQ